MANQSKEGGLPLGGTTGQVLKKKSGSDNDTEWGDSAGGSGNPTVNYTYLESTFSANTADTSSFQSTGLSVTLADDGNYDVEVFLQLQVAAGADGLCAITAELHDVTNNELVNYSQNIAFSQVLANGDASYAAYTASVPVTVSGETEYEVRVLVDSTTAMSGVNVGGGTPPANFGISYLKVTTIS